MTTTRQLLLDGCDELARRVGTEQHEDAEARAIAVRLASLLESDERLQDLHDRAAELLGSCSVWFSWAPEGSRHSGSHWVERDIASFRAAVLAHFAREGA